MATTGIELRAKKEVFQIYSGELVISLQACVSDISTECLAKNLIPQETHDEIQKASRNLHKARLLISAVSKIMKKKGSFDDFILILEKQHDMYDALIKRMRESAKETAERKITTECVDDIIRRTRRQKPVPKDQQMREEAMSKNMDSLKEGCEKMVIRIASECHTKQIISKDVFQKIAREKVSKRQHTAYLLRSVSNTVLRDGKKFEVFMTVLKKHHCLRPTEAAIRHSLSHSEEAATASQTTAPLLSQAQPGACNSDIKPFTNNMEPMSEAQEFEKATSLLVVEGTTVPGEKYAQRQTQSVSKRKYKAYNQKLALAQNEAIVGEQCRKETELRQKEDTIIELENQMREKDRRIDTLIEEKEMLEFTSDTLKRDQEDEVQTLKIRIAEKEKKIEQLNKEKRSIEDKLQRLMVDFLNVKEQLLESQKCFEKRIHEKMETSHAFMRQQSNDQSFRDKVCKGIIIVLVIIILFIGFTLLVVR